MLCDTDIGATIDDKSGDVGQYIIVAVVDRDGVMNDPPA